MNTVWRFRDKSFARVKAVTCFGRGALRLSQVALEVTLALARQSTSSGAGQALQALTQWATTYVA